jgi:hypothetical protein
MELIIINREEEWEVEDIITERTRNQRKEYLVKWLGWPEYKNSWQPTSDLKNTLEVIKQFKQHSAMAPKTC